MLRVWLRRINWLHVTRPIADHMPPVRYYLARVLATIGVTDKRTQNIVNLSLSVRLLHRILEIESCLATNQKTVLELSHFGRLRLFNPPVTPPGSVPDLVLFHDRRLCHYNWCQCTLRHKWWASRGRGRRCHDICVQRGLQHHAASSLCVHY